MCKSVWFLTFQQGRAFISRWAHTWVNVLCWHRAKLGDEMWWEVSGNCGWLDELGCVTGSFDLHVVCSDAGVCLHMFATLSFSHYTLQWSSIFSEPLRGGLTHALSCHVCADSVQTDFTYHLSERRPLFHPSLPPSPSLSLMCSCLPLLLQQMWMAVSLGFPLCPPAKWQWQTSPQTPSPSLSEKHKWLRASSETGARSSESPFSVLPKTSTFRVGLEGRVILPWREKKSKMSLLKMFTETFFLFPPFSSFRYAKKRQCRGCVFVIALSIWKTGAPFPGKDSPPRCESSKLNNLPFILLRGGSCICGERACGGGKKAVSLVLLCNWYPLDNDNSLCIALPTFLLPLFLQQWEMMNPTCVDNSSLLRLSLQCCFSLWPAVTTSEPYLSVFG